MRVGVTGHRAERLALLARAAGVDPATHEASLANLLHSIFSAVERACIDLAGSAAARFDPSAPRISVLVGAAYGADRVAAAVVTDRLRASPSEREKRPEHAAEWRLEAVLPAPPTLTAEAAFGDYSAVRADADRHVYAAEWSHFLDCCDSVTTLPATWRSGGESATGDHPDPPQLADLLGAVERVEGDYRLSYVEAANFQLQQIDLLVAIWDGKPSRGPGGVADIVAHGHAAGLPVIFVDAAQPTRPPVMLQSIVFAQERANVIGWSCEPLEIVVEAADCRDAAIADTVAAIVHPGGTSATHDGDARRDLTLDEFLSEDAERRAPTRFYDWFVRAMGGGPAPSAGRANASSRRDGARWTGWADKVGTDTTLGEDIIALGHRYATVSRLANDYATRYRSTFVAAFTLAAFAVVLAVVGQSLSPTDCVGGMCVPKNASVAAKGAFLFGEFAVVLLVLVLVLRGRRKRFHAKYVEYRILAESLYALRFLGAFGEASVLRKTEGSRWSDWYLRSTARELALPHLALNATFQRRILRSVCDDEISAQITYHRENARRMETVEHRIHQAGIVMFATILLSLFIIIVFWVRPPERSWLADGVKTALGLVTALFPTIGAALAGIRFMADFDGRAIRSRETAAALERLRDRADVARHAQQIARTREILRDLAATLSQDLKHFHSNFSHRELSLPG